MARVLGKEDSRVSEDHVTNHTLSGLITKRAELAGEISDLRTKLRQALIDLGHVDAAIHIFDPEFDIDTIAPKASTPLYHVSFRGEFVRVILDMMREAKGPVTTKEIALYVMRGRGLNTADEALVALFTRRTRALLYHYRTRGMIRGIQGNAPGRRRLNWWELTV
jgi:hypothetical protein